MTAVAAVPLSQGKKGAAKTQCNSPTRSAGMRCTRAELSLTPPSLGSKPHPIAHPFLIQLISKIATAKTAEQPAPKEVRSSQGPVSEVVAHNRDTVGWG